MKFGTANIGVLFAFAAVALWSTNALAAKFALAELGVVQVLALQFVGAATVLAILRLCSFARRQKEFVQEAGPMRSSSRRRAVVVGVCVGVIGLTGTIFLQYLAFATAPIVEANVIAYGWPLFAALWAAVAYRSRRTLAGVPLAVVGFAGVSLMLGAGGGFDDAGGAGYLAALASAMCMTFYTVAVARLHIPAEDMLLFATTFGAACAAAMCVGGFAGWSWSGAGAWIPAIYAGVGPMAGGFYLWSLAMSGDGAKRLAPLGYATPLLSTVLLLFFGESFTPQTLLGAALILVCSIGVLALEKVAQSSSSA